MNWGHVFNGYEYDVTSSYYEPRMSWYEARGECMQGGGDLASIESAAEDSHINGIVSIISESVLTHVVSS